MIHRSMIHHSNLDSLMARVDESVDRITFVILCKRVIFENDAEDARGQGATRRTYSPLLFCFSIPPTLLLILGEERLNCWTLSIYTLSLVRLSEPRSAFFAVIPFLLPPMRLKLSHITENRRFY